MPPATPDQPVLHAIDFRLSYGECDYAGLVYFAAYYPWFERTYNEWAYLGGFPTERMHELWGATHVSVASGCRYHIPGRLHDPLTCKLRPARVGNTSFTVHFAIDHHETGETYADGEMTFVFIREPATAGGRPEPAPVPQGLRDVLVAAGCQI